MSINYTRHTSPAWSTTTEVANIMDEFDLLFKDFFKSTSYYLPTLRERSGYPVDAFVDPETKALNIHVACTGLSKDQVEVTTDKDVLRIRVNGEGEIPVPDKQYFCRGISRKKMNLGYKVSNKFDLAKITAKFNNGLLQLTVPAVNPEVGSSESVRVTIE